MIRRDKLGRWATGNHSGQRFTRERSLGNQNARGNKPNATTFTKGITTLENHPNWKGGEQHMKNDCTYLTIGTNKRVRRPRFIWEQVYGELPKGYVIWHKDGDKNNDDIDNLEAITRSELLVRNQK